MKAAFVTTRQRMARVSTTSGVTGELNWSFAFYASLFYFLKEKLPSLLFQAVSINYFAGVIKCRLVYCIQSSS